MWDEDHRLFTRAGIDTLTVGVFSWSLTQPAEETHDFTVLDRVLDRAAAAGRRVCLATGTAALPPWPAKRYPEVNHTDFEGRRHRYGRRHTFCPGPPAYRRLPTAPAARLAGRCAGHPALETATRIAPDGTRLLLLLDHAPGPARRTAHAPATDLLTGKRTEQGGPLHPRPARRGGPADPDAVSVGEDGSGRDTPADAGVSRGGRRSPAGSAGVLPAGAGSGVRHTEPFPT
ncbi:hypothetical protein SUDANB126_01581 [Streptomyces sp. enrichment culture]